MEISNFVNESIDALKEDRINDFGELLHESWLAKKSLSSQISNNKIDEIYNSVIEKGAVGGKLLGAGGGGFFLFYIPYNKQKRIINYFNKLITIPFNFSNEGSKILFKNIDNKYLNYKKD